MSCLAISPLLPRRGRWRGLWFAGFFALLATSCAGADSVVAPIPDVDTESAAVSVPDDRPAQEQVAPDDATGSGDATTAEALPDIPIESGTSLDSLQRERRAAAVAVPVGLVIESIAVDDPIVPVGVEPNGEMEIPGADEVGWYRFGSSPGEDGSAVLAAHVDYNGREGVFFELAQANVGDAIDIERSDGSIVSFVVTERAQFEKLSLPFDEIFRRSGPSSLVLITCGGDFNPSLRSYEDNVVLFAEPVDS